MVGEARGMSREASALRDEAARDVRRMVDADAPDAERRARARAIARITVAVHHAVLVGRRILDGEEQRRTRVERPIEQARRQTMVLGDREPFPIRQLAGHGSDVGPRLALESLQQIALEFL
jgi:hypothetical protein